MLGYSLYFMRMNLVSLLIASSVTFGDPYCH